MRPFLKWAGGKYALLDRINEVLPEGKRLIEPFAGAGAVFLNTKFPRYLLGEANTDLVALYNTLAEEGQKFIDYCQSFFVDKNDSKPRYLKLRSDFNQSKNARERAALFVYLNRHGFNGLCRYNSQGGFNVPYGESRRYFPAEEMQYFAAKACHADFQHADFIQTMQQAKCGDVIYCDPPYVPLSATASFTHYQGQAFDKQAQIALANCAENCQQKGIPVVISNHDTPFTRKLYQKASITSFPVQRTISRDAHNRHAVQELLAVYLPS